MTLLVLSLLACSETETLPDADVDGFTEDVDCDDQDAAVFPSAMERCDGVDNDCDGAVDEVPEDGAAWFTDADGDGHGDPSLVTWACVGEGGVPVGDDCDDANATIYPGAVELDDGVDQDCDGTIEDETPEVSDGDWYVDADGDGYGDAARPVASGDEPPEGAVENAGDCDDTNAEVHPESVDGCDGVDNDCDGAVDGGLRVPEDHADLQAAIDAAGADAIICVAPGTYATNAIAAGKRLAIVGTGAAGTSTLVAGVATDPILEVLGGEVAIDNIGFTGGRASEGAALRAIRTSVALTRVSVFENLPTGREVRPIVYGERSTLVLSDVAVHDNAVTVSGGGYEAEVTFGTLVGVLEGELSWSGGEVQGNSATLTATDAVYGGRGVGGLVSVVLGAADLADIVFQDNVTTVTQLEPDTYGSYWASWAADVYSESSDMRLGGVSFEDERLDVTTTGYCQVEVSPLVAFGTGTTLYGADLAFRHNTVTNTSGYTTPSMFIYGPSFELDGVVVSESSATVTSGLASALSVYGSTGTLRQLDVRQTTTHATGVPGTAGILNFWPATATVENFIVADNRIVTDSWTSLGVVAGYQTTLLNGDIVNNASTGYLPTSAVFYSRGTITGVNLNIVGNTLVDGGSGYHCTGAEIENSYDGGTTLDLTNVNLHGNTSSRWPGVPRTVGAGCSFPALTGTALYDFDPLYVDVAGVSSLAWDLRLQAGSPAIDAGSSGIVDPDGSVSDLGAYGGPGGARW